MTSESTGFLVETSDQARLGLESDDRQMRHLALGQNRILELIAAGASLAESLTALLRFLEKDVPEMLCSVLLLDTDGAHLRHCAAPSLPEAYTKTLDGSAIGPRSGSCGTAAHRRERVIAEDIETDPLWSDYREFARPHGLRACWSTPILDANACVLGTFAMYFRDPGRPQPFHQRIIDTAVHVAALAIGKESRERAMQESEERYRLLNLATNDAVWDWDVRKNTLWRNEGLQRFFGYSRAEVSDDLSWWVERVHPEDRQRVQTSLHAAANEGSGFWREEYRFLRSDGSYADIEDRGYVMRDACGATTRMLGMMQDITERKQAVTKIRDLAYYEPVTRLPNRAALQTHVAQAIDEANRAGHELALLFLNLNYFRDINDSLGHQNGDLLLKHVADQLRVSLGASGHAASLGGDEFAVLLPRVTDTSDVEAALGRISESLRRPLYLSDIPIEVEATLGIALYPRDGATSEILWQHADVALRTAKERHEPQLFYSADIDHYEPARLALLGDLRSAIEDDQLLLHYQPKIELRSGRTVGIEALVRWKHPVRGLIFPDAFIPLAERTALINPLTSSVVVSALRQGLAFQQAGFPLEVSVNLSARNLHDRNFCKGLLELVHSVGFPLSRLTLELTETAIMEDPGRAKVALTQLHQAGIHLSMDDFGIGQSSLTYLKDLPISKMKIDKSFVMDFDQPRNVAIVRSAIDLARNMGLQVTAEGVEAESTCQALRDLKCDLAQGYFFSKPLTVERLTDWLRESPWGYAGSVTDTLNH